MQGDGEYIPRGSQDNHVTVVSTQVVNGDGLAVLCRLPLGGKNT